jgi:hypothetical protein
MSASYLARNSQFVMVISAEQSKIADITADVANVSGVSIFHISRSWNVVDM